MIMDTDNGIELGLDTLTIKGDPTKLYENLAKAQAEFLPVPKMSEGQAGQKKFKYAGYATLMRCIRPALTAHGIAIIQPLHSREDMAITTTIIAGHGASISCSFSFKADYTKKFKDGTVVDDPQEFGRCHTYYRRYQLQAMLGIEGDSDADDLPDVNEEKAQFSEPAKEPKSAPKASAEPKPAAAPAPKTESAAPKSASTANGKPSSSESTPATTASTAGLATAPAEESLASVNERLADALKQLNWKVADARAFFIEHVNPAGFASAPNMPIEDKKALLSKMIELKGVIPF
jgi:hypothetical protein